MMEWVIAGLCGIVGLCGIAAWIDFPPVEPGNGRPPGVATPQASRPPDASRELAVCTLARAGGAPAAIASLGREPGLRYSLAMAAQQYGYTPIEGNRVLLLDSCTRAGA